MGKLIVRQLTKEISEFIADNIEMLAGMTSPDHLSGVDVVVTLIPDENASVIPCENSKTFKYTPSSQSHRAEQLVCLACLSRQQTLCFDVREPILLCSDCMVRNKDE